MAGRHFFQTGLGAIEQGTLLFDIFACASPDAAAALHARGAQGCGSACLQRVGTITTSSPFVRSAPEARLAFRHQRKEEDYEVRPEWEAGLRPEHVMLGHTLFEECIRAGKYEDLRG